MQPQAQKETYEVLITMFQFFRDNADMIATGGRGDREIFIYKASKTGKFAKQHCLRGHTGWIIQLLFDTENHLLSGSEDATIRLWHVLSGKPSPISGIRIIHDGYCDNL